MLCYIEPSWRPCWALSDTFLEPSWAKTHPLTPRGPPPFRSGGGGTGDEQTPPRKGRRRLEKEAP
eukprot:8131113-Pyramimonas_sp.AAC.1